MKIAFFSTHLYEKDIFETVAKKHSHTIDFFSESLTRENSSLAKGYTCVCAFVNDTLDESVLENIFCNGTKLIALRSAGYDHIDLKKAVELGLVVVRVPDYSPNAIAEHAVGLILALNRKLHLSYNRARISNFSIEGLMGFDLSGKTVGVIGLGRIGAVFARILKGFGCQILAYDISEKPALTEFVEYKSLDYLLKNSDIISLHLSLNEKTRHILDDEAFKKMKRGVMIINTGRGALIDTEALIKRIKEGIVGSAGLDVYEFEKKVFFQDRSLEVLRDDLLSRLLSFPNVIVTSHHAFLTKEAVSNIASITMQNISDFEAGKEMVNRV